MLLGRKKGTDDKTNIAKKGRPLLLWAAPCCIYLDCPASPVTGITVFIKSFWAGWALFRRIIFEICWLSIFKRAQLEVQAYYTEQLIRAMVWNTIALWWHCYGITVNDQNIKEIIEVQSSIKVNWFFWQRMQMRSFDIAWIPTTEAWLTLISMVINLWTAGWAVVKGRGE